MENLIKIRPIGIIYTPFKEASEAQIQPAAAGQISGRVEVFSEYEEGLADLAGFDRIWLIYWFDRAAPFRLQVKPYLDTQERGLFATRAPARPNPIGLSSVKLLGIEKNIIIVEGVDMLDKTPLLDIKPYVPKFDCFAAEKCGWLNGKDCEKRKGDERFFRSSQ